VRLRDFECLLTLGEVHQDQINFSTLFPRPEVIWIQYES
jgi:hypothetical protein